MLCHEPLAHGLESLAFSVGERGQCSAEIGQLHVAVAHRAEALDEAAHAWTRAHGPAWAEPTKHAQQHFQVTRCDAHFMDRLRRTGTHPGFFRQHSGEIPPQRGELRVGERLRRRHCRAERFLRCGWIETGGGQTGAEFGNIDGLETRGVAQLLDESADGFRLGVDALELPFLFGVTVHTHIDHRLLRQLPDFSLATARKPMSRRHCIPGQSIVSTSV